MNCGVLVSEEEGERRTQEFSLFFAHAQEQNEERKNERKNK